MMSNLFEAHRDTLDQALTAIRARGYWSAYPETPSGKIYGETAKEEAEAAFAALLNTPFELDQPEERRLGKEVSPYGEALGITYPSAPVGKLIEAALKAGGAWGAATVEERVGVALEILNRLNRQSFLVANAVMHTSGQGFAMAFQAGGPHAQDRGLEAVAYAYEEMTRVPATARWEKPQGKLGTAVVEKNFRIVPRGLALVIGCATFPTWNAYPGLFASLVTGNPTLVKPHPMAILPLALTVRIGRDVIQEAGFDPNALMLVVDEPETPVAKELALHPAVRIIDFTGSSDFGRWLRENATAQVYTEEAGVNSVVIDSTDDYKGLLQNLAFSLSLYSGQMCTAPQNIFVPSAGVETDEGRKNFDDVAADLGRAVDSLLSDPQRATAILGAVQSEATLERVNAARGLGRVVRDSAPLDGRARSATPLIVAVDASDESAYLEERFGPISFVVKTRDTADAIARAAAAAKMRGAITASLYATGEETINAAADAFADAGVALSVNLTGGVYVNQSAAFSDFHVSGANPSGTASLTDPAFVANRFRIAMMRRPVAA